MVNPGQRLGELSAKLHQLWDERAPLEEIGAIEQQILDLYPKPVQSSSLPQRNYNVRPACIHLGKSINAVVKTKCIGCGGNSGSVEHRPFECAIHKRCLPGFAGPWDADHELEAKLYHLCDGCEEKELPTT